MPPEAGDSSKCSKTTVAPDSGDSSDRSDNSKVSLHFFIWCYVIVLIR